MWDAAHKSVAKRRADAGKARPTNRSLLASLLLCKRCNHSFTTIRDGRWPGPTGEGYRVYSCSGYHRYGKSICGVVNLPGPAIDAFVLKTIQQVLIGDNKTTEKAIDAFVKAILAPKKAEPKRAKSDERDLDLLNRKIKATLGLLADPTFDGMDELQSTLADLNAKRDALTARLKPQTETAKPEPKEDDLRAWALKQFAGLHELSTRTEITLQDRQLVEAYVERIEIYPETKTGVVILAGGLENAYREGSTRLPIGDFVRALEQAGAPDVTYLRLARVGHCPHSIQGVDWLPGVVLKFFQRTLAEPAR